MEILMVAFAGSVLTLLLGPNVTIGLVLWIFAEVAVFMWSNRKIL
jgi:hypothetical protein